MKNLQKTAFAFALSVFFSFGILAQKNQQLKPSDFKISIEKLTDTSVKLICTQGCAWKELTYSYKEENRLQAINALGMTTRDGDVDTTDKKLANFLFTIQSIENKLHLQGLKGTAWKDLSFSIKKNVPQRINRFGMKK